LVWVLLILILVLLLPYVAEQVEFAVTRGKQRAEAEVARKELANFQETSSIYRVVAKAIAPSVVGVDAIQNLQEEPEDEWAHLFQQPRQFSLGSGVIVDPSGYMITNAHVVRNAANVIVKLSDGRTFNHVRIVGRDPLSDIAVMKINATGLVAAPWGNSDQLEAGDPVLAVGNPYGLDRTVTAGIISAKGRRLSGETPYQDFLQTDAAVNPGNSGGPLVNMKGQVVGINTAIVGNTYQGISFAIPSNMAKEVYERLKESGKVVRGWLGVELQPLSGEIAKHLGVRGRAGAVVTRVLPDAPAAQAGIEPGDVIVKWDGKPVETPTDLTFAVAKTPPGKKVAVVLIRRGEQIEVSVTVEERPAEFAPR
jgi:serine protease Do